jgi:high-affinity Fe2+/Pb2+ permease
MKYVRYKYIWYALAIIVFDTLLFGSTNAGSVASYMVIIGFLALGVTLWTLIYGLLRLSSLYGLSVPHKGRFALSVSMLMAGVLALQSIGELGKHDVMVLLPLIVLGYAYTAYLKSTRHDFEP